MNICETDAQNVMASALVSSNVVQPKGKANQISYSIQMLGQSLGSHLSTDWLVNWQVT